MCWNHLFDKCEIDSMNKKQLERNYCSTMDFYCMKASKCKKNKKIIIDT